MMSCNGLEIYFIVFLTTFVFNPFISVLFFGFNLFVILSTSCQVTGARKKEAAVAGTVERYAVYGTVEGGMLANVVEAMLQKKLFRTSLPYF